MSNEPEEKKEGNKIEGEVCLSCPYLHTRVYISSDVDARIKFCFRYIHAFPGFERDYPEFSLQYKNCNLTWESWLINFCFGNMNMDFREKIKRLKP